MAIFYSGALIAFAVAAAAQDHEFKRLQYNTSERKMCSGGGCLSVEEDRSIDVLCPFTASPMSAAEINTTLYHYSRPFFFETINRNNPMNPAVISSTDGNAFRNIDCIDKELHLYIIIHGYKYTLPLICNENANVLIADWAPGARRDYFTSVANTNVVGSVICLFLLALLEQCSINLSKVHLIGHSLGAHVAGFAGASIPGLGQITGLDPANPCFRNRPAEGRLDRTDANYVRVVHTNGDCLGMSQPCGHLDLYPNGGKNQPGCLSVIPAALLDLLLLSLDGIPAEFENLACSHAYSVKLYRALVNNQNPPVVYPCLNADDFENGKCYLSCEGSNNVGNCLALEYDSNPLGYGQYYFSTYPAIPYFCRVIAVIAALNKAQSDFYYGKVTGEICCSNGGRYPFSLFNGKFIRGEIYSTHVNLPMDFEVYSPNSCQISLTYERFPVLGPAKCIFDWFSIGFINPDIKWQTKSFPGYALNTGQPQLLSEIWGKN